MENKRPLILVSNDDGFTAKGISELIKFLRPLGEIVVVAPDAPRSGSGCALTVTTPIHYQLVRKEVGLTVYKCSGTPADCIKLARNAILERNPELNYRDVLNKQEFTNRVVEERIEEEDSNEEFNSDDLATFQL